MSEHFQVMCRYCAKVIAQCRCFDHTKQIKYSICECCKPIQDAVLREREECAKIAEKAIPPSKRTTEFDIARNIAQMIRRRGLLP